MTRMGWSNEQGLGVSPQGWLNPVSATKRSVGRVGVGDETLHAYGNISESIPNLCHANKIVEAESDDSEGGVEVLDESVTETHTFNEADDLIDLDSDGEMYIPSVGLNREDYIIDTVLETDNGADILEIDELTERFVAMGRASPDAIIGMDETTRRIAYEMEMEEMAITALEAD